MVNNNANNCRNIAKDWTEATKDCPCPVLDLQRTGDHYVGKPSAEDQPTRPTQPFILLGLLNE